MISSRKSSLERGMDNRSNVSKVSITTAKKEKSDDTRQSGKSPLLRANSLHQKQAAIGGMSNKLKNKLNKFKKQQACDRERAANLHTHFHDHGGHHQHHDDGDNEVETFVSVIIS